MLQRVWRDRHLLLALIRRQFNLRYRQSFVGFAWAILPPLANLVAATIVFNKVVQVDTGDVPYAVFALAALAPWSLFAGSLMQGMQSLIQGHLMVTRFAFPRAVLPLSAVGLGLVDLGVSGLLFILFIYLLGVGLPATALWFLALLVVEIVFVVGLVLLGSALNVFARDVRIAVPLLVQVWLLLTPVMYPLSDVPESLRPWYLLNPMTGLIESFRRVLVYGHAPETSMLIPAAIGALFFFVLGTWYFSTTESRFADVI